MGSSAAQLRKMTSCYHIRFKTLQDEFCAIQKSVGLVLLYTPAFNPSAMTNNIQTDWVFSTTEGSGSSSSEPNSLFNSPDTPLNNEKVFQQAIYESRDLPRYVPSMKVSAKSTGNNDQLDTNTKAARGPRKGHKKSRRGCFSCKQRKIKCQETQPSCANCIKVKLTCVYPQPKTLSALHESSAYTPNPVTSINLQATPVVFSLTDMRLFHHFLQEAYPHLPVGNDSAWTTQVPLIAHHNEYVMHAILGMAATHLQLVTGIPLGTTALQHRLLAIVGSSEALNRPNRTGVDGDALLASCYLLAFQSSYMPDGMQEFFRTIRGCALLTMQLRADNLPMAFFLPHKYHFAVMQERLMDLPIIEPKLVENARGSLESLPRDSFDGWHTNFYDSLIATLDSLAISSLQSYFKFLLVYQGILKMDTLAFNNFLSPTNHFARILLVHFLAIELIMEPVISREFGIRSRPIPSRYHLDWIFSANRELPPDVRDFVKWPNDMAASFGGSSVLGKEGEKIKETEGVGG